MFITSSEFAFQSRHERVDTRAQHVEVEVWRAPASAPRADTVSLSERSIQASAQTSPASGPGNDGLGGALGLIKQVLEDMLGMHIEIYRPEDYAPGAGGPVDAPATVEDGGTPTAPLARAPTEGAGFRITTLDSRVEAESLQFRAQGVVQTADGREIRVHLKLDLQRRYEETTITQLSGGSEAPRRKDPLVINLGTNSVALDGSRFEFDLDADGVSELIPNISAASGFIALDRNGNGTIDDGSELFGARSGNGFADLAALDQDRNGWIDEADAAYQALRIWRRDETDTSSTQTLAEAGVGALHVGSGASTFEYRDADQTPLAELRATGVYLTESGQAGTLQQLDFFV